MSARTIPVDAYKIRNSLYLTVSMRFFLGAWGILLWVRCSATHAHAGHSVSECDHEGGHGSKFRCGQIHRDGGLMSCTLTCTWICTCTFALLVSRAKLRAWNKPLRLGVLRLQKHAKQVESSQSCVGSPQLETVALGHALSVPSWAGPLPGGNARLHDEVDRAAA